MTLAWQSCGCVPSLLKHFYDSIPNQINSGTVLSILTMPETFRFVNSSRSVDRTIDGPDICLGHRAQVAEATQRLQGKEYTLWQYPWPRRYTSDGPVIMWKKHTLDFKESLCIITLRERPCKKRMGKVGETRRPWFPNSIWLQTRPSQIIRSDKPIAESERFFVNEGVQNKEEIVQVNSKLYIR